MAVTVEQLTEGHYCCPTPDCEASEYVAVCFAGVESDMELGILVDKQGYPTNKWADGTIGVPVEITDWLLLDDCAPYCTEHNQETEWREE